MGKQLGIINVRGAVGDMLFRKTEDGYFVGRKSSVTGDRIKSDPTYKNTRKAMAEFGRAAKAGKLLRDAILIQLSTAADSKQSSRMLKTMMQALVADTDHKLGLRTVQDGEMGFLEGFEFNRKREMNNTFLVQYATAIDRPSGKVTVDIPGFIPEEVLLVPEDATHFRIFSGACELDFEPGNSVLGKDETDYIPLGDAPVAAVSLLNQVTPASTLPIVLVVGVRFYRLVSGSYNLLHGDKFDAMRILKVDQP